MSIKAIIVASSVLAVSATLAAQGQKVTPAERASVMKVARAEQAQAQQGGRGAAPGDIKRFGLDLFNFVPLEGKVVKGMPYSAEIVNESIQTLSDGNRIVHRSTGRVYRDAEGRVRREEDRGSNSPTITITDPVANKSYTLDPATRTARERTGFRVLNSYFEQLGGLTFRLNPPVMGAGGARGGRGMSATGRASGAGSQGTTSTVTLGRGGRGAGRGAGRGSADGPVEEQLPNRNVEGVNASGIRRTTTIAQGAIGNEQPIKIVSEEWTSPDLQVLVLTDTNDPRTGRTTYRLTNINRANPDPALFKVPSDYTLQGAGGRGRGAR